MDGLFWKKSPATKRRVRSPTVSVTEARGSVTTPSLVSRRSTVAPRRNSPARARTSRRTSLSAAFTASVAMGQAGTSTSLRALCACRKPMGNSPGPRGGWKCGVSLVR